MADDNDYVFDKDALHEWWRSLDKNRGRRAELRRCHTLGEVLDTRSFQRSAHFRLLDAGLHGNNDQLAAVAGLLVHIREHTPEQDSFAKQMATADSAGGRPPVSEMRFRRLLRKKTRSKLYKPLRRVLSILGTPPRANIFEVAQDVYFWGNSVHRRWARDYHAMLFKDELVPPEAEKLKAMWKEWWEELQQPERRGERAALRRCSTLDEVQLTKGYHRLLHYLCEASFYKERNRRQHAAGSGLLAHIEQNDERHCFAAQMALSDRAADALAEADDDEKRREVRGQIQSGEFGSAPLSGLRFRRLVQTGDRRALFRKLIRTLRLLSGSANLIDVANAVFYWNDDTRRKWSLDYYKHAASDEP